MPGLAILLGTGLVSSTAYPYSITVGGVEVAPDRAELDKISFEDNGDDETGHLTLRVWDSTNALVLPEQGVILVQENSSDEQVWMGFVQRRWYEGAAVGRYVNLEGISVSSLLDETLVPYESRPAESDRARVLYLWGNYARWPLSGDVQFVTQTDASIAATEIVNATLRSALRDTAALAGSTVRMAIDGLGRLHWFAGSETNPAPYAINVALAPGAGAIAPDTIRVDRDGMLKNRAYVRGATVAGTGWFQDDASVGAYGPRETYLDAPSADTEAKARAIARLYFGRVAQPRTRGQFTTGEPYNGWRAGQNVTLTDPANDLAAEVSRIARVTTTFTKGTGSKHYTVEFGSVGARMSDVVGTSVEFYGPGNDPGSTVGGDVGGPGLQGIGVSDALGVQRVLLGMIGTADNPDYGLKVVSSDGTTVIIDGTSDIFKITATGTLQTSSFSCTPGASSTATVDLSTGFTYRPAFLGFAQFVNGGARSTSHIIATWTTADKADLLDYHSVWVDVVNTNQTRVSAAVITSRSTDVMPAYTYRYYILQEVAF